MKRQSSSSSRRQNSIGCMCAISNLLFKHYNRSKFLISGKKQAKEAPESATKAPEQTLKAANLPRSPTLAAELRRSNSVETPPNTLVARLMGVDKFPRTPESTANKRRKLLCALEKCDEDLKALQRIIELVNTSVSVEHNSERRTLQHHQKQQLKKKPGQEDTAGACCFLDRFTKESIDDARSHQDDAGSPLWRSKAMIQSVDEVCKDIAWGERREIGRIGFALQDQISKDLIDEIVREMGHRFTYSLPFEACKRGLAF
ncbi:PREDICTED: uncharacterized protein LOC18598693 [Theobroma cacao]|uniref:Uncharacterized protein LOC18598693 n=1 Tax=Theobroma cacao TaxID=3641 RepID=A0AB32V4T5_THECC|nr:PREDICTED: uncharacterized protein LOC18598693 [Theobroma cacao]